MKMRLLLLWVCLQSVVVGVFSQSFTIHKGAEGIKISENGQPVLFYQIKTKAVGGLYERAGYIHPLFNLSGDTLTEDAPSDHPYHRGIFWAWHQIVLNGKKVADGWMSDKVSFRVKKTKTVANKSFTKINSELVWRLKTDSNNSKNIVRENVEIKVNKIDNSCRSIDFDIRIAALVKGVSLGGSEDTKGYGGFCLRLNLPDDIRFYSQAGEVLAQETAVTAGPWMNFRGGFGKQGSKENSITIFCKPINGVAVNKWILRKQRSMQNIAHPGNQPLSLSKRGWRLQYRLLIHEKEMDNFQLEKLYQHYLDDINN
jgi:hypothetical protein